MMRGRDPQDLIAELVEVTQATVSRWERGDSTPTLEQMIAIEDHYRRPRGSLLRDAGVIDAIETVEDAIAADGRLTPEWRAIVLAAYERALELSTSETSSAPAKAATRRK